MSKKTKVTEKDLYLVILGVLLGFFVQVVYDAVHEIASILNHETVNKCWLTLQVILLVVIIFFVFLIFRKGSSQAEKRALI